ncbi:cytochrome P450 [Paraburkholderia sp. CNPSo 3281]|uniref:cytochrome P450 n=1 Tax=Paraburkholderia sp. CNPSo 3281 TaxID=2940933 RepID=UPI0020B6BAB6|nr:cytochrome P450 [Paraburkholderia sp. CNPSo 3281]MCP3716184.1 cytochrome P450 [Paraburkholderia sp. CNPSo 3281]
MDAAASSAQRLRQVRDLPCPRGLPLIGNLHQLNAPKLHRVLEQWAEELGTPYRFQICGMPVTAWSPPMLAARHYSQPGRFDPERWLRGHAGGDARVHDPRAWVQFGAGPRVCPGRHLAAMEMRLVLSTLMNRFKVKLAADPSTIEEITAFAMVPSRMPVRLALRPTVESFQPQTNQPGRD